MVEYYILFFCRQLMVLIHDVSLGIPNLMVSPILLVVSHTEFFWRGTVKMSINKIKM